MITNATGLPQPLYRATLSDDYDAGASDITATGLLLPPHLAALERAHPGALTEDVADMARLLIGKAVHAYIARVADDELDDHARLSMMVNGWLVSGQTDHVFTTTDGGGELLVFAAGHHIRDYKTLSVNEWARGLRVEREQQLNIYAALLRANGYAVSSLGATCIFVDWSPRRARYERDYPPASIVDVEVPLWEPEDAQRFILDRVLAHQAARADPESALCSDEERWASAGEWAVMKEGNKRATKLFPADAYAEACLFALGGGPAYNVEQRRREYVRCESYCAVGRAGVCQQWNNERELR